MGVENENSQGKVPEGQDQGGVTPPEKGGVTPPEASQKAAKEPEEKKVEPLYSAEQLNELLNKVRKDEKTKHQDKIEQTAKLVKSQAESLKRFEEMLEEAKNKLESLKETKSKAKGEVSEELEKLREEKRKLEVGMEELATLSAKQIHAVELQGAKERLILKHGLKFPELVYGETVEELEKSAEEALKREQALIQDAVKEAEVRAKEKMSSTMVEGLPKPMSPNASMGNGNDVPTGHKSFEQIAALPKDKFLKIRSEILQEARRKAGI
jgi:DNA repair exonuclease SbcCD ATPase subunit